MAGEQDNAEVRALTPGGVESPRLAVSNTEMATFQSSQLKTSVTAPAEREQGLFGQHGFSFAQFDDIYGKSAPDAVIASNPVRDSALGTDIVRVGMPPEIDLKGAVYKAEHPYRGDIGKAMDRVPEQAWQQAIDAFPQLTSSGLSRAETAQLMQSLVRNELYHYDAKDLADDRLAKVTGNAPDLPGRPSKEATLGMTQISPKGIDDMAKEFPAQMSKYTGKEVQTLLDPKEAPMLIAANLAHNIEMYKRHEVSITPESLAYGFNPSEKDAAGKPILLPDAETLARSAHVKNVMHQMDIIRGKVQPTAVER